MKISINTKVGSTESNIQIEVDEATQNLKTILEETYKIIENIQTPKKVMLTLDGKEIAKILVPYYGGGGAGGNV